MDIIKTTEEYDRVLSENKSVFVDFYADWCGPCKMVAPLVEALSVSHTAVKFVKVNVDILPDVAQRYGIMSIPTMIAFKDGAPVASALGFRPQTELEKIVIAAE